MYSALVPHSNPDIQQEFSNIYRILNELVVGVSSSTAYNRIYPGQVQAIGGDTYLPQIGTSSNNAIALWNGTSGTSVKSSSVLVLGQNITNITGINASYPVLEGDISNVGLLAHIANKSNICRTLVAGEGLTVSNANGVGGDPELALDFPGLNIFAIADVNNDIMGYYNSAQAAHKKVTVKNFWDKVFNYYLTARGDIIAQGVGGSLPTRIPISAAGLYLKSDGTDPDWAKAPKQSCHIHLQDPEAADDGYIIHLFPEDSTIDNILFQIDNGTYVTFNIGIRNGLFGTETDIFVANVTASTIQNSAVPDITHITAHHALVFNTISVSGSVSWVGAGIEFSVP
jgi:hypothetical protein